MKTHFSSSIRCADRWREIFPPPVQAIRPLTEATPGRVRSSRGVLVRWVGLVGFLLGATRPRWVVPWLASAVLAVNGSLLGALRPAGNPPEVPCFPVPATQPNVIIIMADDLGYGDLGVHGCQDIPTPHIDSIARNGVRFTSGYVTAPVCSPSRAALMTGRYQQRFGHETNPGTSLEDSPYFGLPVSETTIGDRFKDLDYRTGWIGKSHLGGTAPFHPLRRGFDEFFGFIKSHHDYFDDGTPLGEQDDPIRSGTNSIVENSYLTTAFARECVKFIGSHTNAPFLLYAAFNAVHFPQQATSNLVTRAAQLPIVDPHRRIMAAMLLGLDDAVGAILATLRQLSLESNTLIFFTTDNGGTTQLGSSNAPLRGGKTELYEGGIRVPLFMQWKGRLATNQVYHAPVSTFDILPTAIAAAGGPISASWKLDGVNLLPFLCGVANGVPHPTLFWRIETDGLSPGGEVQDGIRAVRDGDWKLVKSGIRRNWELYNLAADVGESTNLADVRPEIVQQLVASYDAWSAELARPLWAVDNLQFASPDFALQDIRVGATGVSYIAPEFLPGGAQIAFQDGTNQLWRGQVNPTNGFLASGHGMDLLIDTGLASVDTAFNGAEWGLSSAGSSLFYTKPDTNGRLHLWRAGSLDTGVTRTPLTSGTTNTYNARATQGAADPAARLVFTAGSSLNPVAAWMLESAPANARPLPYHAGGFRNGRWLPGTSDIAYSAATPAHPEIIQIVRYATAAGTVQIISDDVGEKVDICGFLAPEYNDELCYAAVVDRTSIAIYRDLHDKLNGLHTRIASFTQPAGRPPRYIYSLEPLSGSRGYNGTSYFSCAAYQNNDPTHPGDSEIWILGLGPGNPTPFLRRVDEGLGSDSAAERRDPRTFIAQNEILVYYSRKAGSNDITHLRVASTGINPPDYQGAPSGFTTLQFERSFTAGTVDAQQQRMSSTEVLGLTEHQGRLFAATGNRGNFPYPPAGSPPASWTGAQILVKDSAADPWRVDEATPPIFQSHLRTETLVDFTFTTRSNGAALRAPANLLIAGLSDIDPVSVGSHLASVRTRIDGPQPAWNDSHVATTRDPAHTISFGSHVDRRTGIHHIFAGLSNGEIYRGVYDENQDSRLTWDSSSPELSGTGPITAFAECNGFLYAACALLQASPAATVSGGLFVRRDTNTLWEKIYEWPHPVDLAGASEEHRFLRGLTAVPEPRDQGRQVLLAGRAWPGVIERIDPDPTRGHVVTIELDVRDFLARQWNDDRIRQSSVTLGYTGFTPATNPVTGEHVHLVGLWVQHPGDTVPPRNGSHFLIRHRDATYESADIEGFTPGVPLGQSLRATRCIVPSPFPNEPGGLYLGGYDASREESHDTAWIMHGAWSAWPQLSIRQLSPSENALEWPTTDLSWVLEFGTDLGIGRVWSAVQGRSTRSAHRETLPIRAAGAAGFYRLRKQD